MFVHGVCCVWKRVLCLVMLTWLASKIMTLEKMYSKGLIQTITLRIRGVTKINVRK